MPSAAGSKRPLVSALPDASSSITWLGGTRPPLPITVAAGSGLPLERTVVVGPLISVVVRFVLEAAPGRNSTTVPLTRTASPTLTEVGAEAVHAHTASDVQSSASGVGPCR